MVNHVSECVYKLSYQPNCRPTVLFIHNHVLLKIVVKEV